MSAILEEERKRRRLSQAELAMMSGIPYGTFRNIVQAIVDINVPDVVAIAAALSTTRLHGGGPEPVVVTAADLVDLAIERAGGWDSFVSAVSITTDDLEVARQRRANEKKPLAEIEKDATAATRDPEMDTPEPEAP